MAEGMEIGSGGEGRSMNLSPQERSWEGARRHWNEVALARKKSYTAEEDADDPEGRKSRQVILKRADLQESTEAPETQAKVPSFRGT